jgi:hypothetical protein
VRCSGIAGYTTIPATRMTRDDAYRELAGAGAVGGEPYDKSQANKQVVRSAILEVDGPVVCRGDAVVYQAIHGLEHDAVYQEGEELEGRNGRSGRVCDGANVGGAQSARLDKNQEAAHGEQGCGEDVARRAVVEEVEEAVDEGARA